MLDRLKHISLLKAKKVAGLKISIPKSGSTKILISTISKKKGEIEIDEISPDIDTLEDISKYVEPSIPLMITIEGKGIFNKKIEAKENISDIEIIHQVLPNADLEEFYMQKYEGNEKDLWVTIARKELIDSLIDQIEKKGFYINDLILGGYALVSAIPALNESGKDKSFVDDHTEYIVKEGQISKISSTTEAITNPTTFELSNKKLSTAMLISIGSAFQYFFKTDRITRLKNSTVQTHIEDFFHKNLFKKLVLSALGAFLITLLVNFFIFDHYNKKNQETAINMQAGEQLLMELENLKTDLDQKKSFAENSGFINASRLSYYADELAKTMPASILLKELKVNPLINQKKKTEKMAFVFNQVRLVGITNESLQLNEWIKKIKQEAWSNEVNIIDFSRGKNSEGALFELEVNFK